jgi:pimeloyl-ACP methyl ester carboxylesterase
LAVVILYLAFSYLTDEMVTDAERSAPPIGKLQVVDGGQMHYLRQGNGEPVVLIHGLGGLLQDFTTPMSDSLSGTCEFIALDRPGYGYSEYATDSPLTIALQTRMIHALLDSLDITRPLLVGHSLGGAISLNYALTYPEDCCGLVLLAPVAYPVTRVSEVFGDAITSPLVGELTFTSVATPVTRMLAPETVKRAFAPCEVPADYLEPRVGMTTRPSQLRAASEDLAHLNDALERMSTDYGRIRLPVTVIVGDSDQVLVPEEQSIRLAAQIADAEIIFLTGCGHQVQYAFPGTVAEAIRRHLGGSR